MTEAPMGRLGDGMAVPGTEAMGECAAVGGMNGGGVIAVLALRNAVKMGAMGGIYLKAKGSRSVA
jgi:hypothetical protein